MVSLFGDFADEISEAPDDPFNLPDGTYKGAIIEVESRSGKKANGGNYSGVAFTFSAEDQDRTHNQYFPLPVEGDKAATKDMKLSSLKKFLKGLEIPDSKMDSVDPEYFKDLGEVVYTVKTSKSGFKNIEVSLAKGSPVKEDSDDPFYGIDFG